MTGIDVEVLLAAAYAGFLLIIAACLELAARYSHHRSERMSLAGFRYDARADLWTCPNNEKLLRADADYRPGTIFYRAAAHACNNCPVKSRCTDSMHGRVIEHRPDSWLDSELRRFHRGISLMLVVLATLILTVELARYTSRRDRLVTCATLAVVGFYGVHLVSGLIPRSS